MSKYAELIARFEAAEAGSRELDALVHVAVADDPNTYVVEPHPDSMFSHRPGWYRTGTDLSVPADAVTTSLDAALALAERVLPGCRCIVERDHDGTGWACVRSARFMTDARTPALALCIAILRALDVQESLNNAGA